MTVKEIYNELQMIDEFHSIHNYNYYYKMMNFTTMNQTNQNLYYMKIQYMISITLLKH